MSGADHDDPLGIVRYGVQFVPRQRAERTMYSHACLAFIRLSEFVSQKFLVYLLGRKTQSEAKVDMIDPPSSRAVHRLCMPTTRAAPHAVHAFRTPCHTRVSC